MLGRRSSPTHLSTKFTHSRHNISFSKQCLLHIIILCLLQSTSLSQNTSELDMFFKSNIAPNTEILVVVCVANRCYSLSFQYTGVRSLSFRDLLLTVGTGLGSLFFFDMRTCSFLAHRDTNQMLSYRSGKGWLVRNNTDLSILRTLNGTLDQSRMQDNSYLRC